ncbi:ATPase [Yoonia sp. I 8.24]|uniref:ATPase n=1 Tax=Yoonia sp. I 8.24 TaxID=1537229 RepID=UPI001EE0335C|nr:ATPase [Yoonia sp. I 8.24]MCG3268542.1 ATPase [Yoonia sp. I 8.24]
MTVAAEMQVTLRLPTRTLFDGQATRLTAVAPNGAFGILPNHVDFVSATVPSVATLTLADGSEAFFGLDAGLLVKQGHYVTVTARRGVQGDDLESLRASVAASFVQMDEDERQARAALSRLEATMVRHFSELAGPAQ